MFFLITHVSIGKFCPNMLTQFIIGFLCYVISFFIGKDLLGTDFVEKYKYYIFLLIIIDGIFIIYEKNKKNVFVKKIPIHQNKLESDDYKITHELSLTESENTIFSSSDEKIE